MKKILIALFCCVALVGCRKEGCMDPNATTYDVNAKKDNGYCYYAPRIIWGGISNITSNTAECSAEVLFEGISSDVPPNVEITYRGFCYALVDSIFNSQNTPNIENSDYIVTDGDYGSYTLSLNNLDSNSTYSVRAFYVATTNPNYQIGDEPTLTENGYHIFIDIGTIYFDTN